MKQQISGLGVEAQREIIHNHVKNKPILAEYIETESGKKSNRPQLLAALAMCRKTNSVLIVAKLDRLSRNVAFTSKLLESDVEIIFCDFPQANRLILHIISSIAEYEAGLISQRTKQSLQAKKARGIKLGKSDNLMNKFEQAIYNSSRTNKAKAENNPNNMRAIASIKGIALENEMREILQEVGLDPDEKKSVKKYSLGMRQKLGIAIALMENPELIILDEPFNALDEKSVEKVKKIIKQRAEAGALIIVSCHDREILDQIADSIYYMEEGKIIRNEKK